MKRNTYTYNFFTIILLLLIASLSACKKEKEIITTEDTEAKFIFHVSDQLSTTNNIKLAKATTKVVPKSTISTRNNVSLVADAQEKLLSSSLLNKNISSQSPVHNYMRYRLILYNITKDKIEKNIEAEASRNLELKVTAGDEYKWYAYSYNTLGSVDTAQIINNIPVIRTLKDKEFLWASSGDVTITATNQAIPVSITFDHKVAEVVLEIDTKNLYGKVTNLNVEFDDPNYFNTAEINLFTGNASEIQDYNTPTLSLDDFKYDHSSDSTILRAVFYTAVPQNKIENLKINIKKLSVLHVNNTPNDLLKPEDPSKSVEFLFSNPHMSKSHVASIQLKYTIPSKKILHVIGHYVNNDDLLWAFGAQPYQRDLTNWSYVPASNGAPLNMIKEPRNFGTLPESIVQTAGFTHLRSLDGQLEQKLTDVGNIPDIVIIAVYYRFTQADILALTNYINNGGVVIMMTDAIVATNLNNFDEINSAQLFLRTFLEDNLITLAYPSVESQGGFPTSSMFELNHNKTINDQIINGPFGNLSGKYWGVDTAPVVQAQGLDIGENEDQVTVYSNPNAINSSGQSVGVSMFKHNSKNFFWIGDGSFLSHPSNQPSGWSGGWNAEPFATVNYPAQQNIDNPIFNYTHYPMPKPYGRDYLNPISGNVGYSYGSKVYNAPLFANLIAWATYQAEFFGTTSN